VLTSQDHGTGSLWESSTLKIKKGGSEKGVMVHTHNPSTRGIRQENYDFKASLGYIERPCLKKRKFNEYSPSPQSDCGASALERGRLIPHQQVQSSASGKPQKGFQATRGQFQKVKAIKQLKREWVNL
jgi:hypothetical protein